MSFCNQPTNQEWESWQTDVPTGIWSCDFIWAALSFILMRWNIRDAESQIGEEYKTSVLLVCKDFFLETTILHLI